MKIPETEIGGIMYKIAVAMACHNRKETTLRCLASLFSQDALVHTDLDVFLMDDGSSDGTAESVGTLYQQVRLLFGNGTLYWNGSMYLALTEALNEAYDFHLWLNDDVRLYPGGLGILLKTHEKILNQTGTHPIIAGTFCDPDSHAGTYGGQRRSSAWHPFRFETIFSDRGACPCHTFHGNGVLIPRAVIQKIGIIDHRFSGSQNIGDTDYGLRATRNRIPIYTSTEFIGKCRRNPTRKAWNNSHLYFKERWELFSGPKGIQIRNYLFFARRHGGAAWMIFGLTPMIKALPGLFFPGLFQKKQAGSD